MEVWSIQHCLSLESNTVEQIFLRTLILFIAENNIQVTFVPDLSGKASTNVNKLAEAFYELQKQFLEETFNLSLYVLKIKSNLD